MYPPTILGVPMAITRDVSTIYVVNYTLCVTNPLFIPLCYNKPIFFYHFNFLCFTYRLRMFQAADGLIWLPARAPLLARFLA